MLIRSAVLDDAERLLEIYAYYVRNTAISFECSVPLPEEFRERIRNTLKKYHRRERRGPGLCVCRSFQEQRSL